MEPRRTGPDIPAIRAFEFHLYDEKSQSRQVHADVLADILKGFQSAVYMIAMDIENSETRERGRVPSSIKETYGLICSIPEVGCYSIPVEIAADLVSVEKASRVGGTLLSVLDMVDHQDTEGTIELIQNDVFRRRALGHLHKSAPSADSGWRAIIRSNGDEWNYSSETRTKLGNMMESLEGSIVEDILTGELGEIDFFKRRAEILYPVANTMLSFGYVGDDHEMFLIENRRSLIHLDATVKVDAERHVTKIRDVHGLSKVNQNPIVVSHVLFGGKELRFRNPISLSPVLSECRQLMVVEHAPLDINVFAETRELLLDELFEQIYMLWVEYALEDDALLCSSAQQLKYRLLDAIEEVASGSE